ncbi:MAG: NAD-dependent epimerase/dehydratase family protein [Kiritimatiellae bacterium]|nr:NAD-dependent epimerase/dehydratase family protein [Kiritimatiellia bacterium]
MKTALVCGAGGFIGSHLARELVRRGVWVRGVDLKMPEFSPTAAQDFKILDLRDRENCVAALAMPDGSAPDAVFQLAAEMGGMGYIHSAACEIMHDSVLINAHMVRESALRGVKTYFFSSSVCVYRDMKPGEPAMAEDGAYPAAPDNDYGWEKLYSERMAFAHARRYGMKVRVARFQNCYGPEGTWRGGREKAPAALSRKVAEAHDGGTVDIWGDGLAVRNFIYVDDLVDGILHLVGSDLDFAPANIGTEEYVTVRQLLETIAEVAGKKISFRSVDGPVGVASRNFSTARIRSTGWAPRHSLRDGIAKTYPWVAAQVAAAAAAGRG